MNICILESDTPPPNLLDIAGTYADMFETWLSPVMPGARFTRVAAYVGDLPVSVCAHDGYLITGSLRSAYDDIPWIHNLRDFVRLAMSRGVPVGGVCFGHQLMAKAMGGQVALCEGGWSVGETEYQTTPNGRDWFEKDALQALSFHRDQVVTLPMESSPLAGNTHCPWAALAYGNRALSVQFHPEFVPEYVSALIRQNSDGTIPVEQAELAVTNMVAHDSNDAVAQAFAKLFQASPPLSPPNT
jgi:GMP synthase-like glutamine amidotransferase